MKFSRRASFALTAGPSRARLLRDFNRLESERVAWADAYQDVLRDYRRLRRPDRQRALYYGELLPILEELERATDERNRAAARLEGRVLESYYGIEPTGTEYELTATTAGGSPRHTRPGAHDTAAAKRRRRRDRAARGRTRTITSSEDDVITERRERRGGAKGI